MGNLAFAVPREDDENTYDFFYFTVMIYGLSTATRVLNLITQPIIDFILSLEIKIIIYIDDLRTTYFCRQILHEQGMRVKKVFNAGGFCFDDEKETEASQKYQYLGFSFDTRKYIYSVPAEKLSISKMEILVNNLAVNEQNTPSQIASIVGKLISCEIVCGLLPRLVLHPF